jgi:GNAT superfamily N-acetyltransferase
MDQLFQCEFRNFFPGALAKIIERHAVYYAYHWEFTRVFEIEVAEGLAEFAARYDPERDLFLTATTPHGFAGAIVIDGSHEEGARLRWFITDSAVAGRGVGRSLIGRALRFCREAGHTHVFLWTFQGLEAARKLYEEHGFRMTETHDSTRWGPRIVEQKWELEIAKQ